MTAVVSLATDAESIDDDALIEHARQQIAAYKTPRRILRVGSVLRGPNGKADYAWARRTAEDLA